MKVLKQAVFKLFSYLFFEYFVNIFLSFFM
jgi:hypothetical protein